MSKTVFYVSIRIGCNKEVPSVEYVSSSLDDLLNHHFTQFAGDNSDIIDVANGMLVDAEEDGFFDPLPNLEEDDKMFYQLPRLLCSQGKRQCTATIAVVTVRGQLNVRELLETIEIL